MNAPEWTFSTDMQYRFSVFGGTAIARAGYQWRDDTSIAPPPFTLVSVTDQPSYDLLDLGLSYTTPDEHWHFAVDAKSVTDEWYRTAGVFANMSQIGYYGPPRTHTFSVAYRY